MTDNGFDVLAASHVLVVFAAMLIMAILYDWWKRTRR
jgi:hypothetical protein